MHYVGFENYFDMDIDRSDRLLKITENFLCKVAKGVLRSMIFLCSLFLHALAWVIHLRQRRENPKTAKENLCKPLIREL